MLGVALIAGLWLATVIGDDPSSRRAAALPRWLGWSGLAVVVLVTMPAGELVGLSLVGVSTSSSVLHLWFLAVGIVVLVQARRIEPVRGDLTDRVATDPAVLSTPNGS